MLLREVVPRGTCGLAPPGSLTAVAVGCQVAFTRRCAAAVRRGRQLPDPNDHTLAERWNGNHWTTQTTANP